MRKYCIIAIVCLTFIAVVPDTNAQFLVKAGADFLGSHKSIPTFRIDGYTIADPTNIGTNASVEFIHPLDEMNRFLVGIGVEYLLSRALKDIDGSFGFISFYPHIRVRLSDKNFPHFLFRFGFNILYGDDTYDNNAWPGDEYYGAGSDLQFQLNNFFHYGLGGGIFINEKYLVELIYSVNMGKRLYRERVFSAISGWDLRDRTIDVHHSRLSLSVGYRFGSD